MATLTTPIFYTLRLYKDRQDVTHNEHTCFNTDLEILTENLLYIQLNISTVTTKVHVFEDNTNTNNIIIMYNMPAQYYGKQSICIGCTYYSRNEIKINIVCKIDRPTDTKLM